MNEGIKEYMGELMNDQEQGQHRADFSTRHGRHTSWGPQNFFMVMSLKIKRKNECNNNVYGVENPAWIIFVFIPTQSENVILIFFLSFFNG